MPRLPPVTSVDFPASPEGAFIGVPAVSRSSGDAEPAVDDERVAVDHRRFRQAQKVDGVRDVFRTQYRAGWRALREIREQFFAVGEIRERIGVDDAGTHRVDANAA